MPIARRASQTAGASKSCLCPDSRRNARCSSPRRITGPWGAPSGGSFGHDGLSSCGGSPDGEVCTFGVCTPVGRGDCPISRDGGERRLFVSSSPDPSSATTLTVTTSTDWKNARTKLSQTINRGRHRMLAIEQETSQATGEKHVRVEFGEGFHGIRHAELHQSGRGASMTIDGREVASPSPRGGLDSLQFEDGRPAPSFRIDERASDAITAIYEQAQLQMVACSGYGDRPRGGISGPPTRARSGHARITADDNVIEDICKGACNLVGLTGGSGCNCCADCCFAEGAICLGTAFAAFVVCAAGTSGAAIAPCAIALAFAQLGCQSAMDSCTNACYSGSLCCGPQCNAGTETVDCPYPHCSPGASCCTGPVDGMGSYSMCCNSSSDCCGGTCLEGIFAGSKCINSGSGTFCPSGFTGDVCSGAQGTSVFGSCCPSSQPECRATGIPAVPSICCASGAGDVCGTTCCPADLPQCAGGFQCCAATDTVCGLSCCPPPGICTNGQCCNPPSVPCGSGCCDPTQGQVCTPARGICCGGSTVLGGSTFCGEDCCLALRDVHKRKLLPEQPGLRQRLLPGRAVLRGRSLHGCPTMCLRKDPLPGCQRSAGSVLRSRSGLHRQSLLPAGLRSRWIAAYVPGSARVDEREHLDFRRR